MSGSRLAHLGSRLDGYRGIVVVLVLVAIVLLSAVSGLMPRLMCAIDEGVCSESFESDASTASSGHVPTPSIGATGSVELPAASDERAVPTVPGEGTVPAGRGRTVAGDSAPAAAGTAPLVSDLWGDTTDPAGMTDTSRLVEIGSLACGAPGTGPCDVWEDLQTDTGAALALGPTRLTQAGLDPFVGQEEATTVVDTVLGADTILDAEQREVLYRSSQRTRDGALTESWTWQDGDSLRQVVTRRSRDGTLHSLTVVGIDTNGSGTVLVRTAIPVTGVSVDVLEDWLTALPADRSAADSLVADISGLLDTEASAVARVAFRVGSVQYSSIEVTGPLTALTLRDHPDGDIPGVTVLAVWDLDLPDEGGNRSWTPVELS